MGTWLVFEDARLRVDRRFQIFRPADGRTLLRGLIHYVCVDLDSGRPRRMPVEFVDHYRPLPGVAAALALEHHCRFAPGVDSRAKSEPPLSRAARARDGAGGPP